MGSGGWGVFVPASEDALMHVVWASVGVGVGGVGVGVGVVGGGGGGG